MCWQRFMCRSCAIFLFFYPVIWVHAPHTIDGACSHKTSAKSRHPDESREDQSTGLWDALHWEAWAHARPGVCAQPGQPKILDSALILFTVYAAISCIVSCPLVIERNWYSPAGFYCTVFFSDLGALFSESCKFSAVQYHICVLQTDREASSAEGVLPCFTRNTVKMWSPEHFRSFVGCHCSTAHRGYSTVLYMISTPDYCKVISSLPFCHRVEVFFFAQMSLGSEKLMFFWKPYLWESLSIKPSLPKNFCLTLSRGLTVNLQYRITTV